MGALGSRDWGLRSEFGLCIVNKKVRVWALCSEQSGQDDGLCRGAGVSSLSFWRVQQERRSGSYVVQLMFVRFVSGAMKNVLRQARKLSCPSRLSTFSGSAALYTSDNRKLHALSDLNRQGVSVCRFEQVHRMHQHIQVCVSN